MQEKAAAEKVAAEKALAAAKTAEEKEAAEKAAAKVKAEREAALAKMVEEKTAAMRAKAEKEKAEKAKKDKEAAEAAKAAKAERDAEVAAAKAKVEAEKKAKKEREEKRAAEMAAAAAAAAVEKERVEKAAADAAARREAADQNLDQQIQMEAVKALKGDGPAAEASPTVKPLSVKEMTMKKAQQIAEHEKKIRESVFNMTPEERAVHCGSPVPAHDSCRPTAHQAQRIALRFDPIPHAHLHSQLHALTCTLATNSSRRTRQGSKRARSRPNP